MKLKTITIKKTPRLGLQSPWIYSNEIIKKSDPNIVQEGCVLFETEDGGHSGIATYNKHALISARVLTWDKEQTISTEWFSQKLQKALSLREQMYPGGYYRWIYGESDGLPGLVVDRYGPVAVVEVNTAGMECLLPIWLEGFQKSMPEIKTWIVRRDSGSRELENLPSVEPVVYGAPIESEIIGYEGSIQFVADLLGGQKTGWFYDQRENRAIVSKFVTSSSTALDLCTHTGSFALYMAQAGAQVTAVDISAHSLSLGKKAASVMKLEDRIRFHQEDIFEFLKKDHTQYNIVVVDPPAFIKGKKSYHTGMQGYIKLLTLALKRVCDGGFLCFTSCSYGLLRDDLQTVLQKASRKSGKSVRVLTELSSGFDHPIEVLCPEMNYLKGVFAYCES